ncbi:MAG: TetR/AcrR family transcriptional regulator [Actinomycetota bacterium]|nr:TetR/AcrR family transcriptional regulator [Actinomycetota bacterium]
MRTRFPIDERRSQLVRVGLREFSRRPYDAVSIDEIATAAGVSKGLLYHYFPSKRDFYIAVIEAAASELRQVTEPAPELGEIERLRASLEAYLSYVQQHAEAYVALMRGGVGSDDQIRKIVDETRDVVVGRVFSRLGFNGEPSPILRLTVRGWIGYVEAASLDWLERRDASLEELRDLLVTSLVVLMGIAQDLASRPAPRA